MFEDYDDYESTTNKVEKMPIYQKGREIVEIVRNIADLIEDEKGDLGFTKGLMIEDAYMLTAKIVNAEGGDIYSIRMENAAIIRRAGNNLKLHIHSLKMFGFEHTEYYIMVRQKVEEYRVLFIDWVASFDKTNYFIDDWGLFNPPGVELPDDARIAQDDYDPDRINDFFDNDDEEDNW